MPTRIFVVLSLALSACTAEQNQDPRCDPQEGDWAFVVLPDTQNYAESFPEHFVTQLDWIAAAAQSERIEFVLHEGDITNDNSVAQWRIAEEAFSHLEAIDLPYLVIPGNHDYDPGGSAGTRDSRFSEVFGPLWPWGETVESAVYPESGEGAGLVDNSYAIVNAGGQNWLLLGLEFGPRNEVVEWAKGVLRDHRQMNTIVLTHAFLYSDGTRYDHVSSPEQLWSPYSYGIAETSDVNDGQELWRELIEANPQVRFVFSGHVLNEGVARRSDERGGFVTHQVLANYQHRNEGGGGFLRLVRMTENVAHVCTYSPSSNSWMIDELNSFDLEL